MKQSGIPGELLHILPNYLSNRKQRVLLTGQNMSLINVYAEVSQESILVPLLFLIYINDLPENLTSNAKPFADDTSLILVFHHVNASAAE